MKHLILAFLLLLCHFGAFSQDVWQWLNPQPAGFHCLKITFTDRQHGFILNYNGDLMRTSDQGGHWQITDRFPTATSMDIADSTGVITCSNGKLYVSSDNGNTWSLAQSSLSLNLDNPVEVISRDTFFLAGNAIYRSTDRGKTVTIFNTPTFVYSFTFLDSKTGFAGGYQSISKTTDGGQTWMIKDSVNYFRTIQFLNADTGFAIGATDTLMRTYDGGETWSKLNIGITPQVIQFINSKTGFAGGGSGQILRTDDGGTTWTSIPPAESARSTYAVNSLYFFDENTGFSVGRSGLILKTTNGGQTWNHYSPTYLPITAVSFPTAQTGYMSDWQATFKTTDGGQHWDSLSLVTGSTFVQAHFSSADTGYFLSTNPVREHRTTDGGQTWSLFNPASTDLANAPGQYYFGPHSGFLSCDGQLLKTVDDGASWSMVSQALNGSEWLSLIFFTDSLNGFAKRNYNQLMKTTDGGLTWSLAYTDSRGITGLWFFDPLNGFFVDNEPGGVAYVTHDGGISFAPVQITPTYIGPIHTVGFLNRQVGYFTAANNGEGGVGTYGQIYKTIDGGQTWQLSVNDIEGNSIVFTPDSSVLVAGNGGQLVKSKISSSLQIGSLTVNDDNACGEIFSVTISAILSSVDSISFIYTGPGGNTDTVAATPDHVQNGLVSCTASVKGFIPGAVYSARMRLQINGVYQISNPINFRASGISQPVIKDSAGYLVSSIDSANHWFRNGIAIPSALGRRYYPDSSGIYTVQTIMDSCRSAMSDTVNITQACTTPQSVPAPTVTNNAGVLISSASQGNHWFLNGIEIPDAYDQQYTPIDSGNYSVMIITACAISPMSNVVNFMTSNPGPGLHIHPNPVSNQLVIDNQEGAPLEYIVMNIVGKSILTGSSSDNQILINTRALPAGQYILRVRNRNTSSISSVMFLRF